MTIRTNNGRAHVENCKDALGEVWTEYCKWRGIHTISGAYPYTVGILRLQDFLEQRGFKAISIPAEASIVDAYQMDQHEKETSQ